MIYQKNEHIIRYVIISYCSHDWSSFHFCNFIAKTLISSDAFAENGNPKIL